MKPRNRARTSSQATCRSGVVEESPKDIGSAPNASRAQRQPQPPPEVAAAPQQLFLAAGSQQVACSTGRQHCAAPATGAGCAAAAQAASPRGSVSESPGRLARGWWVVSVVDIGSDL